MTATHMTAAEYVEAHLPILESFSRSRRFRPDPVHPDEFQSDLVLQVLVAHSTFRLVNNDKARQCKYCGRRGCSTWLGWRARKVASNHFRKRDKIVRLREKYGRLHAERGTRLPNYQSEGPIIAKAQLQQLMDKATPEQRDALISKLEGWTRDEVQSRLGIKMGARNWRIRQLMG